jgi:type I restriction enzyme, S subunit
MNFDCLPDGWEVVKLGDIIFIKNGYAFKSFDYSLDGIPLIRISDIKDGKVLIDNTVKIPIDQCKNDFLIEKGDLLIAMSGATTGKTGIYEEKQPSLQNQRVGNFKIKYDNILDQRFRDFLISFLRQEIEKVAYGGAQPNISSSQLEKIIIPLPPLNEQKRIVNKIEKLQDKRANVKAELEAIARLIPQFRQSVLASAFRGDLTANWRENNPDVESAELLLEKIKIERQLWYEKECEKAIKAGKRKPLDTKKSKKSKKQSIEITNIPNNWIAVRLEDISYLVTDGTHKTPKYQDQGVPFLSVKNVRPFKIFDDDIKFISQKESTEINNRCNPEKGDILYTKVGATFGYAVVNTLDYDFSIFVSLALIKPVQPYFYSRYAEAVMNSNLVYSQATERVTGIGTPDLHLIEIRDFKIPLPPLEEQKEIVRKIETAFKFADRIEREIKTVLEQLENLNQSILAKAFRGELVPQISTDEPASMLLAKIQQMQGKLNLKTKQKTA